jgi:hypothetical protein
VCALYILVTFLTEHILTCWCSRLRHRRKGVTPSGEKGEPPSCRSRCLVAPRSCHRDAEKGGGKDSAIPPWVGAVAGDAPAARRPGSAASFRRRPFGTETRGSRYQRRLLGRGEKRKWSGEKQSRRRRGGRRRQGSGGAAGLPSSRHGRDRGRERVNDRLGFRGSSGSL